MSTTNVRYTGKLTKEDFFNATCFKHGRDLIKQQVKRYTGPSKELLKHEIRWL